MTRTHDSRRIAHIRNVAIIALAIVGLASPVLGQGQGQVLGGTDAGVRLAPAAPNRPVPRLPDGTVDLGGIWSGGGFGPIKNLLKPGELESLLLPDAKKIMASRIPNDDPMSACLPAGPLRLGSYAWRFVQWPTTKATHIFQLQEFNAHTYRQIFMDGRAHPKDPDPTWYGHSIGRWEGDTLVIDTIGLNDKFWLTYDFAPHTEQLHLIERWTRTDYNTLRRDVTIDDPGAYTRPFTVTFQAKLGAPDTEILEYFCYENNQYRPWIK